MTKKEFLNEYLALTIEVTSLDRHCKLLGFIGGPQPIRGVKLDGMPRGTNDPTAAMIQRDDYEKYEKELERLEEKRDLLRDMLSEFEHIMDGIQYSRDRTIIRSYYALGDTDEQIGNILRPKLTGQRVNQIRNEIVDGLDDPDFT